MKLLLIGLLTLGSFSSFAQTCSDEIDQLVSFSSSLGGSEAILVVNEANREKFKVFSRTLEQFPEAQEIGGYSRETLKEAIAENNESIRILKRNIEDAKKLIETLKQDTIETCK